MKAPSFIKCQECINLYNSLTIQDAQRGVGYSHGHLLTTTKGNCSRAMQPEESTSYWKGTGRYEALLHKLYALLPKEGEVVNPKENKCLEKFRRACNCYYDLFNNGLCNRAREFRTIFKFSGGWIAKNNYPFFQPLEDKMDEFVLCASQEQGFLDKGTTANAGMKSEKEVRDEITILKDRANRLAPLDCGRAILGSRQAVLEWVVGDSEDKPSNH